MGKLLTTVLFSCFSVMSLFASLSYAQNDCPDHRFSNNIAYTTCNSLPVLNSFLHWTYHQSNHSVDIAYRHTGVTSSDWVAWALNLGSGGMLGAECLVAYQNSSGQVRAYTSLIQGYDTQLQEGPLSFGVSGLTAEFTNNNQMVIYASIQLPSGRTSFTQVWQNGPVSGGNPGRHALSGANIQSASNVDFATGSSSGTVAPVVPRLRRKNVHGVLNAVSWGILMPMGAMFARYLKVFKAANPAWFYLHVACQVSAYAVGVAGWGTGLKLGSDSSGLQYDKHRNIGIALFALGTVQMFALLLRPKPDHKYRIYWNFYHWSMGYAVIILSIVNIFEGFDILDPEKKWKRAYIGVLIALGAVALVLEAVTWYIVFKRKSENGADKFQQNGINGYNNGRNQQQDV